MSTPESRRLLCAERGIFYIRGATSLARCLDFLGCSQIRLGNFHAAFRALHLPFVSLL
jgi:hypothetical protein